MQIKEPELQAIRQMTKIRTGNATPEMIYLLDRIPGDPGTLLIVPFIGILGSPSDGTTRSFPETTEDTRKEKKEMKKNKMMRAASALLVLTLLSVCVISGTFAKYVTSVSGNDEARVAKWGFTQASISLDGLFKDAYDTTVKSSDGAAVIAPGTTGSKTFDFTYGGNGTAPEVSYTFDVSTDGSTIADDIKANTNIQWKLDNGTYGTWDDMIAAIEALSGDKSGTKTYGPNELPTAFKDKGANTHTISWQWLIDDGSETKDAADNDQNVTDTNMGNKTDLDQVKIVVSIKATQID